jgi:large subunit ribosomal protein L28
MPKNLSLFGRYIRNQNKFCQRTFRKYQVTKLIPNSAMGRVPSAGSQMGLWHSDDFNAYWNVSAYNTLFRKRTAPFVFPKSFSSENLNSKGSTIRVTPSALYAMDEKGGFDEYIMRTPPEELRSNLGEKLRRLMYFYMENPRLKRWGLPWKVLMRKRDQTDPSYARFQYSLRREAAEKLAHNQHKSFSPYFLPSSESGLFVQRDRFLKGASIPKLNLWWKRDSRVEAAFRRRLEQGKSFEEAYPDHNDSGSYRKGEGVGGGGKSGGNTRPRSKTYRSRVSRSY